MLKKIALFLFCSCLLISKAPAIDPQHYSVTCNKYDWTTIFSMAHGSQLLGTAEKSWFQIKRTYDLFDASGAYEGYGSCRVLCLGVFYVWGTEIDIYDAQGNTVGLIDGQLASSEQAKFSIYNAQGNRVGIAYLDQHCSAFSIVDPNNPARILARLSRNFVEDTVDYWNVMVYDPQAIAPSIIKVFAVFACDTQGDFKADK